MKSYPKKSSLVTALSGLSSNDSNYSHIIIVTFAMFVFSNVDIKHSTLILVIQMYESPKLC